MTGYTVQVKRPRNQDPLEALVFQGAKRKRSHIGADDALEDLTNQDFIFRLSQTYDTQQKHVLLQRFGNVTNGNKLRIADSKKRPNTSDTGVNEIPSQLQSMITEYMKNESPEKSVNVSDIDDIDKETEDYVYDVYYTERAGPLTGSKIGYIEADEEERKLIFGNLDSDDDSDQLPDDEDDSNAEDYYKNDYPDEEDEEDDDDSLNSILQGDHNVPLQDDMWSEADDFDEYERYGWTRH